VSLAPRFLLPQYWPTWLAMALLRALATLPYPTLLKLGGALGAFAGRLPLPQRRVGSRRRGRAARAPAQAPDATTSVRLAVTGEDRRGLYADIMEAISQTGTNIRGADLHTKDGTVFGTIFVEVDNLPHLGKVMKAVRRVKGVTEIERREAPGT